MCILDMVVQSARSACRALASTLYPEHCLLTGERLSTAPTYAPGVIDTALLFHQPAPRGVEIELLIQRHVQADDLMISQFASVWALSQTSTIDNAIYAIKYGGRTHLAIALGRVLAEHCMQSAPDPETLVCPVPIHPARRRERGYNQAELIAKGFCERSGLAMLTSESIIRNRYTESQTTKSDADRRSNVSGIFTVPNPDSILNTHILLIDDVLTTGSTLNACATALIEAGARSVDAATLCVAV
jgi:ComF family protein